MLKISPGILGAQQPGLEATLLKQPSFPEQGRAHNTEVLSVKVTQATLQPLVGPLLQRDRYLRGWHFLGVQLPAGAAAGGRGTGREVFAAYSRTDLAVNKRERALA